MSDEREIEIVAGTVGAIIQKGEDKWQVEITPMGSQYAKKCWTKSPDTHALAATLIGQFATFECGVSHWAKQDGTPVKSLWINAINPGAPPPSNPVQTTATPTPPPAGPQQAPQRLADPTRDSIEKQVVRAWQLAYQRNPTPDEARLASRLVADHGLKALCRALFNSNEFVTIE